MSGPTYPPAGYPPARRSRTGLYTALAVVGALVLAGGGVLLGRATAPATTAADTATGIGSPSGPFRIVDGIPQGYSPDTAGAATAAVNAVQVDALINSGRVDPARARTALIATGADASAQTYFDLDVVPNDYTASNPANVQVLSSSATTASVKVWAVVTISNATTESYLSLWGFTTLDLVWESGDWKVLRVTQERNDNPGAVTYADIAPWRGGAFTFYTGGN